jgi:peptidoglycan/xylan/chitin deacetylase (PgdA/CDA1 family)
MTRDKLKLSFYYSLKPIVPRALQIMVRRKATRFKLHRSLRTWPINPAASKPPEGWQGWPNGKKFAFILMHDVDTAAGHSKCRQLMGIEKELGVRSSFNFVPERYEVSSDLRGELVQNGFEVGVHGLKHDGKLFLSRRIFESSSVRINHYLKKWKCTGFTSPSMLRRFEWMHDLHITHATSCFDTDPFEPQPAGVNTIFPFWVNGHPSNKGYVELPYTLPQDHCLFVMMREKDIDIWKMKLDWIAVHGGMALLNTHPDYMKFDRGELGLEEYPKTYYEEFLKYVQKEYAGEYWQVLPSTLAAFWRTTMVEKIGRKPAVEPRPAPVPMPA